MVWNDLCYYALLRKILHIEVQSCVCYCYVWLIYDSHYNYKFTDNMSYIYECTHLFPGQFEFKPCHVQSHSFIFYQSGVVCKSFPILSRLFFFRFSLSSLFHENINFYKSLMNHLIILKLGTSPVRLTQHGKVDKLDNRLFPNSLG